MAFVGTPFYTVPVLTWHEKHCNVWCQQHGYCAYFNYDLNASGGINCYFYADSPSPRFTVSPGFVTGKRICHDCFITGMDYNGGHLKTITSVLSAHDCQVNL